MRWQAILGKFLEVKGIITFLGEQIQFEDKFQPSIGNFISDQRYSGGEVSALVSFEKITEYSACDLLLFYYPVVPAFLTAGIGSGGLFSVRSWGSGYGWSTISSVGDRANLERNREYHISVQVIGSRLTLTVDGVDVIQTILPTPHLQGQVGIWCRDVNPITIRDFTVKAEAPIVFVIMQFTKPYNELFSEVIKPICEKEGIRAIRSDDVSGPGLIIGDISRKIAEGNIIVAEISPANPNVYYEVGFAHALQKPTILIAELETKLPFDVSPFRTIFYENTIEGKRRVEESFRKHLRAVLSMWGIYPNS